MSNFLFVPPIAFMLIFILCAVLSFLANKLSIKPKEQLVPPYSCGEEFDGHLIQPDYSQFFPFAFFFTILHVVAMVVATVPVETPQTFLLAFFYVIVMAIGLIILLRR